jgi:IS605 OrfB family transposase
MTLTAHIQLRPDPLQHAALLATLGAANAACNDLGRKAFDAGTFRTFDIHKNFYRATRAAFGLGAQCAIRCIAKVDDAYATQRAQIRSHNLVCAPGTQRTLAPITFKPHSAQPFDARNLTYRQAEQRVSIWTVHGRMTIPYLIGEHHAELMRHQQGESDLAYVNGRFYLLACCEVPDEPPVEPADALGIDLGIVNIATDSDGTIFSGSDVEARRQRFAKRRAILQSVGTKSARRALKKLSRKQHRYQSQTNHLISKAVVRKAKASRRAIVLEDLTGISRNVRRAEKRLRSSQRSRHANWSFRQLRGFIAYKAQRAGVALRIVDAANTSRTCSACGFCDRGNRKSQSRFVCGKCSVELEADINAARNIRNTGSVNMPMVATPSRGQLQATCFAGGR